MDYNFTKFEPIFNYYNENGFSHSLQEISEAVNISKKTFFNRYESKEQLERYVVDYWQIKSCERLAHRMEFANNSVEKLMMFLFELQYSRNKEFEFFQKTKEFFLGNFEQNSPYILQLVEIFNLGLEEKVFLFESDPKVFAYFFQFNTLFILLNDALVRTDYLSFLFHPILTEFGKEVFSEINIEQIFK